MSATGHGEYFIRAVVAHDICAQVEYLKIPLSAAAAENLIDVLANTSAPIYLVDQALMSDIAGFNIHRGCLAIGRRPPTPTLDRIVAGPLARVLVL